MAKKRSNGVLWGILVVLLIAVIISGTWIGLSVTQGTEQTTKIIEEQQQKGTVAGQATSCPTDGSKVKTFVKVYDTLQSTETQIGGATVYAQRPSLGGQGVVEDSATVLNSGWTVLNTTCDGGSLDLYLPTTRGTIGSAQAKNLVSDGKNRYVKMYTNNITYANVRFYDALNDDYEILSPHNDNSSASDSNAFAVLNQTIVFDDTSNSTIAVGTSSVTFGISLQAGVGLQAVNDMGYLTGTDMISKNGRIPLQGIICLDDGTDNEWNVEGSSMSMGSQTLTDVIGDIDSDSARSSYIRNSEACWGFDQDIADNVVTFTHVIAPNAGQNPDVQNDDLKYCVFYEGTYQSTENSDVFKTGYFDDSTSRTPIVWASQYEPCLTVHVS